MLRTREKLWIPNTPRLLRHRGESAGGVQMTEFNFLSELMPAGLTFNRAGAGTYFGSDGLMKTASVGVPRFEWDPLTLAAKGLLIEESRTNLVLHSQDFTQAVWTKARLTPTPNAIMAPDGTMTGTRLQETVDASTKSLSQNITFAAGLTTVTMYAKAGERTQFYLSASNSGTFGAHFNLDTGTLGTTQNTVTASMTRVGNGWWRCTLTWLATAGGTSIICRIANGSNITNYTGDGVSGLYIWGGQLELGGFATSYIPTTTAAVTRPIDTLDSMEPHFSTWFNKSQGTIAMELSGFGAGKTCGILFIQKTSAGPRHQLTYNDSGALGAAVVNDVDVVVAPGFGPSGTVPRGTVTKLAFGYAANDFAFTRDNLAPGTDLLGDVPMSVNVARFGFSNNTYLNGHLRRFRYWPVRQTNTELRNLTV